jgi:MYXO-CTERM domain-containing protein
MVLPYSGSDDYTLSVSCAGSSTGGGGNPGGGGPSGIDDTYEDNDRGEDAAPIECPAVIDGFAGDQDWYSFTTTSSGAIRADLTWRDAGVDLDLYITNATDIIAESITEQGTNEQTQVNSASAGTYSVVVNPYEGTGEYRLELTCEGVTTTPTDPSDPGTDTGVDVEPGDPNGPEKPVGGCACSHGGSPPWYLVWLPFLALGRRRQR